MTSALLVTALLLVSATEARAATSPKVEAAQRDFNRGNFQAALRTLDAAAGETTDPKLLARIHLLRGQTFAAQQDFTRAEEAFQLALENDPEAALDPARVDPSLVRMLDGLRERLRGELVVGADRPAKVSFDGKPLGTTPVRAQVPIGRHTVEAKTPDGRYSAKREVVVRTKEKAELELVLEAEPEPYEGTTPADARRRPFADLRGTLDPFQLSQGPGVEVGGGFEFPFSRVSLHARVFREFGLAARGALVVPVTPKLNASVELELPVIFSSRLFLGLGGGGGLEYVISKWLGVFFQAGARHYFLPAGTPPQVPLQLGVRLRLP